MTARLHVEIRTPHALAVDLDVRAIRVPTATGQVGLRPRGEPLALVVEPGLIVLRADGATRYAATAGGLLRADREHCVLYTPFAVEGTDAQAVLAAIEQALEMPGSELAARKGLDELEQRIVRELGPSSGKGRGHG